MNEQIRSTWCLEISRANSKLKISSTKVGDRKKKEATVQISINNSAIFFNQNQAKELFEIVLRQLNVIEETDQ